MLLTRLRKLSVSPRRCAEALRRDIPLDPFVEVAAYRPPIGTPYRPPHGHSENFKFLSVSLWQQCAGAALLGRLRDP